MRWRCRPSVAVRMARVGEGWGPRSASARRWGSSQRSAGGCAVLAEAQEAIRREAVGVARLAEQEPLTEGAPERPQLRQLRVALDALGDDGQAERPAHVRDRGDDGGGALVLAEAADEGLVDLQQVDGES